MNTQAKMLFSLELFLLRAAIKKKILPLTWTQHTMNTEEGEICSGNGPLGAFFISLTYLLRICPGA